jgi:hypothetical protein
MLTASGLAASLSACLAAILVATLLPFCVSVVTVTMSSPRTSVSPHVWPSQVITASAVGHHMDRVHSAIPLEELSEVLRGRGARKVANTKVHNKVLLESVLSQSPEYASYAEAIQRRNGEGAPGGHHCGARWPWAPLPGLGMRTKAPFTTPGRRICAHSAQGWQSHCAPPSST